jgi:hypothetical protein
MWADLIEGFSPATTRQFPTRSSWAWPGSGAELGPDDLCGRPAARPGSTRRLPAWVAPPIRITAPGTSPHLDIGQLHLRMTTPWTQLLDAEAADYESPV